MTKKRVLIAITDGVEEIEAIAPIDILRRAGAEVVVASVDALEIIASRGIKIVADCLIDAVKEISFDLIVLPGGPGASHLRDDATLTQLLKKHVADHKLYAAICAAPVVILQHHGLLENKKATCHPHLWDQLHDGDMKQEKVVVDDNCITSQGPGTALLFGLKCVEKLFDAEKANLIAKAMCLSAE